ncbi:MAG TPA: hypothetical protein VGI35_01690 [Steroidobacteraceae bacterium]
MIVSLAKPQWTVRNGAHFPFPGVGHIVAGGDAYAWRPDVP